MNSRKSAYLASVLVCLCLCGPLASPGSADVYLGAGDVHQFTGGALPVVSLVNLVSEQGNSNIFNNTITSTDPTQVNTLRVVGGIRMFEYEKSAGAPTAATYDGSNLALVFAVEGTSTPTGGGGQLFEAKTGRFGLFKIAGAFDRTNPNSWGATTGSGVTLDLATPIAVWDLSIPDDIVDVPPGPGIFSFVSASNVNRVAVNTLTPTDAQGTFLAGETTTYAGAMLSGNDYWTTTSVAGGLPPNYTEAAVIGLEERLTTNPSDAAGVAGGAGTDPFEALNVIALKLGGLTSLDASGRAFATQNALAVGGDPTDPLQFDPFNLANLTGSDNIFVGTGVNVGFGLQQIPEPGSVAIFGLILGGAGLVGAFRRRRARAASQA